MADQEHVAILSLGVDAWNEWREREGVSLPDLTEADLSQVDMAWVNLRGANLRRANLHEADLNGADLSGADLGGATLRGANLRTADLSWAYLSEADLRGADLGEANLSDANLCEADLVRADLSGSDLSGAQLRGTNLFGADLRGANFSDTFVAYAKFADVDLSVVKGLRLVRHGGPSTLGIDTIYRSNGEIPEEFLRGSGVPDSLIHFIETLNATRTQNFTCFICHSSRDKRFCDRLYTDLRANCMRTWYFPEDAPWGKRYLEEVELSTRLFDRVIAVCSKHSLSTTPVPREVERTLNREQKEQKEILVPIQIDRYAVTEWEHPRKAVLMERLAADFTGWRRSAAKYESAFRQLLRALNTA